MNEKALSALQKAQAERKRGQFPKAIKRLEQAIEAFPDELDLYLECVDVCLDEGDVLQATNLLKAAQDKFTRERERVNQFTREKLQSVHDPSLARCVVEHAVKRRDLEAALAHLADVPDHIVRELLNRARTKKQSLKQASHGGYSLRSETLTNEISGALLAVRLGQMKEAMATFVQILEEKPVEQKMIDPFLASLESKNPKSGRIRFARACSMLANGVEVDAIPRFVETARLDGACAAICVEQLRTLHPTSKYPAKVQRALAEVLLIKGDLDDAVTVLREYAAVSPDNAREIVMLLKPFIDPAHGINACTWLAVETALTIDQSNQALDILRPLQSRGGHGHEIFEWLEEKARAGFLPVNLMLFHGSLALDEKQYERAAEVLNAVLSNSPQDTSAVMGLIDKHRSAHPALESLYVSHAESAPHDDIVSSDSPAGDDGADFQMFENKEFRLENEGFETSAGRPPVSPSAAAKPGNGKAAATPASKPLPRKSLMDSAEFTLDALDREEAPAVAAAEPVAEPVAAPVATLVAAPVTPAPAAPMRKEAPAAPPVVITEEHVANVAQKLYLAGAAAFFHVDDVDEPEATVEDVVSTAVAVEEPPMEAEPEAPAEMVAVAEEVTPAETEPAAPMDFESEYERYGKGELDNTRVVALIERATEEGRVEELHELLYFEPRNDAEDFARRLHQAEYLVLRNRPLPAIRLLERLAATSLPAEQSRRVLYRMAACQRSVRDYAAAKITLERLVAEFPDSPEYERLSQRNYEQYLNEQCAEATVLEKTSSLD